LESGHLEDQEKRRGWEMDRTGSVQGSSGVDESSCSAFGELITEIRDYLEHNEIDGRIYEEK
jgi:hypothetical protein